ncbi:hypothetical protein GCM10010269_42930 [Streptomyces humidus]|uniref:Uncharacterized protein n=1 Tax=Streptomyces humidus TaxID=52259 RepID=A0A918FYU5_9ACTN|nr:hypothetical protein [Streptomyces humidus]GGR99479.1 hypothetical protein GCM10010269_42930 [Streptomyces humidus]
MEQRIGSSSQPLEGAGFDPAFIPGLTSPATAKPADGSPAEDEAVESGEVKAGDANPEDAKDGGAKGAEPAAGEPEAAESAAEEEPADGPVFEAADRRARFTADARGVRLRLDEEACEFRWDEIGAIETESPRFGKRFTITVHTPDRRWYPIEIEATARARFQEWEDQLDAVLDAYFEEGEAETPDANDADAKDADVKDADVKDAD